MYKKGLDIIDLKHIGKCDYDGLDACWLAIKTFKNVIVCGSVYHNPEQSANFDYKEIEQKICRIKRELKNNIIFVLMMILMQKMKYGGLQ